MATNTYFDSFNKGYGPEQRMYEDLIIESIQMYGHDVIYIPRNIIEEDKILNEEVLAKFDENYKIEMYLKEMEGFEGDDLLSKFGLQVTDNCTLIVSKLRYKMLVDEDANDIQAERPNEGDLIYVPFSGAMFEIKFVEDQVPFFQLNNLPVYELRCELFQYQDEDFDTGIDEIDEIEEEQATSTQVYVTVTSGVFTVGEKLDMETPAGVTIIAELGRTLSTEVGTVFALTNLTYPGGDFIKLVEGTILIGRDSGAEGVIGDVIGLGHTDFNETTNESFPDNSEFEIAKDDFIDFSEDNPFGD